MIVAMQEGADEGLIQQVIEQLVKMGFEVHRSTGARMTVLGAVGSGIDFDIRILELLPGVQEVHRISSPYKLAGRSFRPEGTIVKLANGIEIAATFEELLLSAEYIMAGGNYDVILCERGIRTFETYTRNTMDISAIPIIHKLSHLPMTADPSHGTGRRDKVAPMARASVAAGADALLIEVHCNPDKALSDGAQSLFPEQFAKLMDELRMIAPAVGRKMG